VKTSGAKLTRTQLRELRASTPAAAPRTGQSQGSIASFKDAETESIFHGRSGHTSALKRLDSKLWPVAQRKLDMVAAAVDERDLRSVKGNHFEKNVHLAGGHDSIRINEQFRVTFRSEQGKFHDVQIVDYHKG